MSLEQTLRAVAGRLSLREPQAESLRRLAAALDAVPALRDHKARDASDLAAMVEALKGQFPNLSDFERDFPSLCFALATGVGKTRLMGAFISYLNAAYGYKHFFVLAPNLTIYDKLIRDFTPGTPKYVFKGIAEFSVAAPEVITGETYEQRGDLVSQAIDAPVQINIFNISKINTEVRGGRAPRIKRLSEYLGQSYFDYLASLPDLVLLMDESHRYRASAGVRALNELKPLLAMELTATPFTESGSGNKGPVPFKNVVMDYPLAQAIEDGFVKEPAVVTQQNFDAAAHSAEQLERIKLMDGVRVHEETKVHLLTYAQQKGASGEVKPVKPFMLVIARDTTHAAALSKLLSVELFDGRYAGKVIQVDSGTTSGAEGDEIVQRLLAVESYDEPTEIVIHVNMLKEGWDVTNLYTIVPLRAANARTLIEQSIGRGLRLPYGRKTGVEAVDRLNIIAHDKFQEVVDEAGRGDSPIRLKQLKLAPPDGAGTGLRSVAVTPTLHTMLGITAPVAPAAGTPYVAPPAATVLYTGEQAQVAAIAMDVINDMSRLANSPGVPGAPADAAAAGGVTAPTTASLTLPEVQAELVRRVQARVTPAQGQLLPPAGPSVEEIVKQTADLVAQHTIDIPRILVKPKGAVSSGYRVFSLDVSRMNFQPQDQQLVGRGLQTGKELLYGQSSFVAERRPEDYIVRELIGFDDIAYDQHGELLYELAAQAVAHFRSYLGDDEKLHNVLANQGRAIADNIHAQMTLHYFEDPGESEVVVSQGFTPLKPGAVTADGDVLPLHQAPPDKSRIATLVYGGFTKCAYSYQKFQSDTERVLAVILERDARKWLRPVAGQFNIYYRRGADQPEYVPDFVAATDGLNLLIETKKAADMQTDEVQAKARAAAAWCEHASAFAAANGSEGWKYLLIPHDAVTVSATLSALTATYWFRTG
ncbi:DEAD/DEAH box helicase family protein [uncultured Methylibium sp.]|uniref:DEAD/DEAH box helicase n=1 Tax=uncultured Methylibium sp. TaxID=381093 RepID=UPI0025D47368|nr:DEAD/DEAH box helicase family protein [uncultured Methylibium sp.]